MRLTLQRRRTIAGSNWATSRAVFSPAARSCLKEIVEAILGHLRETFEGTYNACSYDAKRCIWFDRLVKDFKRSVVIQSLLTNISLSAMEGGI